MTRVVRLDFCCNDPDNGLFDGRVAGVQLPDLDLELMASDLRGPTLRILGNGLLRIGRRTFKSVASKEWFGNWCWNAYFFAPPVAVELLCYLHSLGKFSADQGEERLFALWRRTEPFGIGDRDFIERRLVKGMLAEQSRSGR